VVTKGMPEFRAPAIISMLLAKNVMLPESVLDTITTMASLKKLKVRLFTTIC